MNAMKLQDMFCTECSLPFNKKIVFDLHLSLVHGKKINIKQEPNSCEISSEDTETFIENNCADKPFECKISSIRENKITNLAICDYSSTTKRASKDDLKEPISSVHEGKEPFKCDTCDACFANRTGLRLHISSIHENKRYKCAKCDASFTQDGSLKRHVVTNHEGKKPFQCDICAYSCSQKRDLNKHVA